MAVSVSLESSENLENEPELDLGQQISRITQERGSFAKLNEEELVRNEANRSGASNDIADQDGEEDAMDVDSSPGPESEDQPTFDELRAQLVSKVGVALNETALNLDFVSLLVSATRPQAGESSISPMLKSQTPLASLNAASVSNPAPTVPATSGYGWKVRAFNRSATSMLDASKRLADEAKKECRFWQDVLEATSKGEVVNRKLRVTYGFRESGSFYFDKGTGSFVRDEETGHAVFKPTVSSSRKLVRVTVFADGKEENVDDGPRASDLATPEPEQIVGRCVLPYCDQLNNLKEPVRAIRIERNNLFEHELMYQLIQEARGSLAPHRVKLQDGGKVVCELFGGRIELDLVDDEALSDSSEQTAILPLSNPAQAINYSLHLLLTNRHRASFDAQHDIPKPLNSKTSSQVHAPPDSAPAVLQPVLAHIHHSILVARTLKLIQVMLPNEKISVEPSSPQSLLVEPKCLVRVNYNNTDISFEIRSPISNADDPLVVMSTPTKTTEVYDLTELELWLKWATRKS